MRDALQKSVQNAIEITTSSLEATASGPHLDLIRAPYVLYGVLYIDPVSLPCTFQGKRHSVATHLDLSRAPYVLYGVEYIDPVSLVCFQAKHEGGRLEQRAQGQSTIP